MKIAQCWNGNVFLIKMIYNVSNIMIGLTSMNSLVFNWQKKKKMRITKQSFKTQQKIVYINF